MAFIALANLKDGVRKSTLTVNIAGVLAPKVVLADADSQYTLAAWNDAGHLPSPLRHSSQRQLGSGPARTQRAALEGST